MEEQAQQSYDLLKELEELRQDGYIVLSAEEFLTCEGGAYRRELWGAVGADARYAQWGLLVQGGGPYKKGSVEAALSSLDVLQLHLQGYSCKIYAEVNGAIHVFMPPAGKKKVLHPNTEDTA